MCVRLVLPDEAAQAVYVGKNVRLLTRNITVTNVATPDRASGPQDHGKTFPSPITNAQAIH